MHHFFLSTHGLDSVEYGCMPDHNTGLTGANLRCLCFAFFYEMRKSMYDLKVLLSLPIFPSRDPVFISLNNKESNVRKKKSWKYLLLFSNFFCIHAEFVCQ